MDIKHRKSRKKSKILRKPERNTETGVNATKKMDIKPRKSRKKVQNSPEAREKYGTEQEKMDIKHRKAVKKFKKNVKPERNTEPGRRKWT